MAEVQWLLFITWLGSALLATSASSSDQYQFGTYYKLFSAQSLWNSKPINPIFDVNVTIPTSTYYPAVGGGIYSTGVFLATSSDPPVTIYPKPGNDGVWNVDNYGWLPNITLPHWPSDAVPATGSDGHCDVVDEVSGILHSFWQLSLSNGRWIVQQYAWANVTGLGFGDPSHIHQGARAAGNPTSGGLIRKHEVDDGNSIYLHALAMSLDYTGLASNPTYVYPATAADSGAETSNTGHVPEGALVMLPSTYNTTGIASYALKKVADTLKVYGAYVVDRNTGTPFEIYVENNSTFKMSNLSWDNDVANELQRIRAALRVVISADKFVDGNGNTLAAPTNVNLLSMRGPGTSWYCISGDAVPRFDTWSQSLVYDQPNTKNTTHSNGSKLGYNQVSWGMLEVGKTYTFSVATTGNAQLSISISNGSSTVFNSGYLTNGKSMDYVWPSGGVLTLSAFKPAGPPGSVRGFIVAKSSVPATSTSTTKSATTTATTTTSKPTTSSSSSSSSSSATHTSSSTGPSTGLQASTGTPTPVGSSLSTGTPTPTTAAVSSTSSEALTTDSSTDDLANSGMCSAVTLALSALWVCVLIF